MRTAFIIAALLCGCGSHGRSGTVEVGECRSADECNPDAPYADKAACDDGDPATADRCADTACAATCVHFRVECDGYDPPEVQSARCDDGDPCTADRCLVSACVHSAVGGCR